MMKVDEIEADILMTRISKLVRQRDAVRRQEPTLRDAIELLKRVSNKIQAKSQTDLDLIQAVRSLDAAYKGLSVNLNNWE